jgi:hypothetical protein
MQAVRSKELLEGSNAKLLGVVINAYDLTRRHRLANSAYGYAYGYGGRDYGRYGYSSKSSGKDGETSDYYFDNDAIDAEKSRNAEAETPSRENARQR